MMDFLDLQLTLQLYNRDIKDNSLSLRNRINKQHLNMDKVVHKIAALGVPGLIFMVAVAATGLSGAAAITAALAAIGPGGMIGGLITLGLAGVIAHAISEYGFDTIFKAVVKELYKRGESKATLRAKVEKYPISKSLKLKVLDEIDKL